MKTTDLICCPYDHDFLKDTGEKLVCHLCKREYPILNGIILMVPDSSSDNSEATIALKKIEREVRDEQVDTYLNWFGDYTNKIEYYLTVEKLNLNRNDIVVDIGCGVGRYTLECSKFCRYIIAIDHSYKSLFKFKEEADKQNIKNILFIQADVNSLPILDNTCNKVISNQVLTFIPGKDNRMSLIENIYNLLKEDGIFVLTVFNYHIYRKIKNLFKIKGVYKKEGFHHLHKFYYYNYDATELKDEIKKVFNNAKVTGICNFPRESVVSLKARGFKKIVFLFDRIISKTIFSYFLGDLLLAESKK